MQRSKSKSIIQRKFVKLVGRIVVRLLTRFEISGKHNLPKSGAYIMAGNHVGAMEVILLVCFASRCIEVVGAGDIPLDPKLAPFADLYGFIPINRGEIDQSGLNEALSVLKTGGVLGVFPEGGIWESTLKAPKPGIAWLSLKAGVPVIPIGFSGMKMALSKALKLKFPKMKMVIGAPIEPVQLEDSQLSLKDGLLLYSKKVMSRIVELLPEDEQTYSIFQSADVRPIRIEIRYPSHIEPKEIVLENKDSFAQLIQHPVIMDVVKRNLKITIDPLTISHSFSDTKLALSACTSLLALLDKKPGFLTYRFGVEDGIKMRLSLVELRDKIEDQPNELSLFRVVEDD